MPGCPSLSLRNDHGFYLYFFRRRASEARVGTPKAELNGPHEYKCPRTGSASGIPTDAHIQSCVSSGYSHSHTVNTEHLCVLSVLCVFRTWGPREC